MPRFTPSKLLSLSLVSFALCGCADDAATGTTPTHASDSAVSDASDADLGSTTRAKPITASTTGGGDGTGDVALSVMTTTVASSGELAAALPPPAQQAALAPVTADAATPVAVPDTVTAVDWGDQHALVVAGGGLHLVFGRASGDATLAHGTPRLADRESYVVHASLPDADLPDAARAWRRAGVEVITDRGARCAARVGAFEYRVDVVPGDASELLWPDYEYGARVQAPPLRGEALAARVWESAYTRWVTARLTLANPAACEGTPLFAHRTATPDTRVALPRAEVPRREAVLSAFRALPAYAELQAEHERLYSDGSALPTQVPLESVLRWDAERTAQMQAFATAGASSTLVSVSVPAQDCDAQIGPLWAVFRVTTGPNGVIEPVHVSKNDAPTTLRLIVEGGDGRHAFVTDGDFTGDLSVIRGEETLAWYATEYHGCSC